MARQLMVRGDFVGALRILDDVAEPVPLVLTMRAFALARLGNHPAALDASRAAVRANPTDRDAHLLLFHLLMEQGERPTLRAAWRGLVANPDSALLWRALASTMDLPDGAALDRRGVALRRAATASPADERIKEALSRHLTECSARARFAGNLAEALALATRAISAAPSHGGAWAARMYANQCREDLAPDDAYAESVSAGRAIAHGVRPIAHSPRDSNDGPLRLAVLAATLDFSSVWYFLAPLLDRHDPSVLSITLYDDAPDRLRLDRTRVRAVALSGIAPPAIAERIAAGGHDVLFDVMGYGHYGSRLSVLAARPAPFALTGIGYPGTLGLDTVDWKLSDPLIHPDSGTERLHEQPLRLPFMLCYRPPAYVPPLSPRRSGRPITFGSFNQLNKIGPTCLEAWRLALAAVPGAVLVVRRQELAGREDWLRERFAAHGLPTDRIRLEAGDTGHVDHLDRYAGIDIAFDTYPYNGTTTTCEALWMGVPVVTLVGDRESSRTGVSLLTAAEQPENAVSTPAEFAARVRALVEDVGWRAAFRQDARERLRNTPLFDETRYARSFEAALVQAVRGRAAGIAVRYHS